MPACSTLGRYDGAGLGRLYHSLLSGLGQASIASWVVLLGPYGLYLLFRGLRAWWRGSAHLPDSRAVSSFRAPRTLTGNERICVRP